MFVMATLASFAPFALAQKGTDNHGIELQAHERSAFDDCADLSLDANWTAHPLLNHGAPGIRIGDPSGQIKLTVGVKDGVIWAVPAADLDGDVSLPDARRDIPYGSDVTVVYFDDEITVSRFEHAGQVVWHVQSTDSPAL